MTPLTHSAIPSDNVIPVIAANESDPADRPDRTTTSDRSPEVLRCNSTADFLAALPMLAGFTAENSLFIVCFQGNRGGNVIRLDLPESDEPHETNALLDLIIDLMRQSGAGAERPAAVITTTLKFADAQSVPRGRLAHQLKRRFRREGWRLRELAVIAGDGWCGLLHNSAATARPLSEIEQSPILGSRREHACTITSLTALGRLPEPNIARARSIENHLAELQQRRLARSAHPASSAKREGNELLKISQAAAVAEACFAPPEVASAETAELVSRGGSNAKGQPVGARPQLRVPDRLVAKLIDVVQTQTGWLVCVLTALTRSEFVVEVVHETGTHRITDIDLDALPDAKLGTGEAGWNIRQLLATLAHDAPSKAKLRRVIDVVAEATAHAPDALRPPLLAVLAWAWWASGMQSVALRIAGEALVLAPDNELLLMVQHLCEASPSAHMIGAGAAVASAA